jgi:hypothetical protein
MLFGGSQITGLFCFENRRAIFEGVHRNFKFVVLTFKKGGRTQKFPAAFMRRDLCDLKDFPRRRDPRVEVSLVRRLSPDSLSVAELETRADLRVAQKMARFPLLGERIEGVWNLRLTSEFHMTADSPLFRRRPARGRLPLYEGKMIRHFAHGLSPPRYWIDEEEARARLLAQRAKTIRSLLAGAPSRGSFDEAEIELGYTRYRLGLRAVTGATNERALVAAVLPRRVFAGNSLIVSLPLEDKIVGGVWRQESAPTGRELLAAVALLGSFVCDWLMRRKILTNLNIFYVYELPVPRLSERDPRFAPLTACAARLVCTAPEFDDLAREAGLTGGHAEGVADRRARALVRADLDARVAHLYGLDEDEFAHVLSAFPLVCQEFRAAALAEFRRQAAAEKKAASGRAKSASADYRAASGGRY